MISKRRIDIIIIVLILIMTIVLGALINEKIKNDSQKLSYNRLIEKISIVIEDIEYTEIKENNDFKYEELIEKRYDVYNNDHVVAYIYTATSSGLTGTFSLAVSILNSDGNYLIHKVDMYSYSQSDKKYAELVKYSDYFYPYFNDFDLKNSVNVDAVSQATITSNSSIKIIDAIKAQVQKEFNIIFSKYEVSLLEKRQNFTTLNFEYDINVLDNVNNFNIDMTIIVNQNYEILNEDITDEELIENINSIINKNKFNNNNLNIDIVDAYITSVNIDNDTYTIKCIAKGYIGLIEVTYIIKNKEIMSTSVDLSKEVALNHTPGISDNKANNMAQNGIDSVSGATYSSNAIIKTRIVVLKYIKEVL